MIIDYQPHKEEEYHVHNHLDYYLQDHAMNLISSSKALMLKIFLQISELLYSTIKDIQPK